MHKEKSRVKSGRETITIDASGKILGRLASEVAITLRGKGKVSFVPYEDPNVTVRVYNLDNLLITGNKSEKKLYWHHTGYPGGIKSIRYKDLFEKDPTRVFYKAVYGMLPKNKLRARILRRLRLSRGEIAKGAKS